jgi:multidrug efflux pump subunit AcrA (membrane-fusion protein)
MATVESDSTDLLGQARRRLRRAVEEMFRLAAGESNEAEFFEQLLDCAVVASEALAGAIWRNRSDQSVELLRQRGMPATITGQQEAGTRNARLIVRTIVSGAPLVAVPTSQMGDDENGDSSASHVILVPIKVGTEVRFVLQLLYRPDLAPSAQRNYVSFARQLADAATLYLKNTQLRQLEARQAVWQQLNQLTEAVHASLRVTEVGYAIANEGHRIVGCDRVSLALRKGNRFRIAAVSGQDTLDNRSTAIRRLNDLINTVARTGRAMWYNGDAGEFSPQIQTALTDYVEHAHVKIVGIVPIPPATAANPSNNPADPLGVLVVEQIEDTRSSANFRDRAELVCEQCQRALQNAREYESLFLLPLWRLLGKSRVLVQARMLPKTIMASLAAAAIIAALIFIPYDFNVHAPGTLQPVLRRQVFAAADGIVDRVFVAHGQRVERGQLLAQLRNTDLDVAITDLTGQLAAAREQLAAVSRSLVEDAKRLTPEERNRFSGQRMELQQRLASLQGQLDLQQQKRKKLEVRSPLAGEVTTWNVDELLLERPVRQGQALLDVADASSAWELEVRVPEDQMGYVADARASHARNLDVVYRLATDPEKNYQGQVQEVHLAAEIHGTEENTVLVRVQIDKQQLTLLQPGAECRAKIHCGRRSLGFVLLHDVVGFIQSRILFRL